jgi:alpha-beta hydrolase superfamily lysophospholipase
MSFITSRLRRDDGVELAVYEWALRAESAATAKPRAVVQLSHGMAEHARRYAYLAEALVAAGYAVFGSDHRGHGQTARSEQDLGYFAPAEGWRHLVDDLYAVNRKIAAQHPGVPIVLFGHSMGSFLLQDFLFSHPEALHAAVLSGTNFGATALVPVGLGLARLERLRVGAHGRSKLLQLVSFGEFNRAFKPTRTEFDWINSDPAGVDAYLADPLCGFALTTQGWIDVMGGLLRINDLHNVARVPKHVPVYLFAGAQDPVGRNGAGVLALAGAYRKHGVTDVTHKLYPGGRHEMVNERNRDEVIADLVAWLNAHTH